MDVGTSHKAVPVFDAWPQIGDRAKHIWWLAKIFQVLVKAVFAADGSDADFARCGPT
jgi:hypothetical protein